MATTGTGAAAPAVTSPETQGLNLASAILEYLGGLVTSSTSNIQTDIATIAVVASQAGVSVADSEISALTTKAISTLPAGDQALATLLTPTINTAVNSAFTNLENFGIGQLFGTKAKTAVEQTENAQGNFA